jgi:hypothetical protein
MTIPSLRPLSTGELLDRTFSLYRSRFLLFAGIVAVTHLALVLLQLAGLVLLSRPARPFDISGASLLWLVLTLIAALAVTAASQGATVIAVSHVYLGRPITVAGALGRIRQQIIPIAMTMIVIGLMAGLGFLLLIVPGVILSLMWALAIPVAVLEERTMMDAASRSSELTQGGRLRVLLVYCVFLLLTLIVTILFSVPVTIATIVSQGTAAPAAVSMPSQIANILVTFVTQCLTTPLMTIGLSLLYYDQRVRKEAFDLELMMSTIDGQPDGAGAGRA